jgi:3-phenylpropionate/trans-cinnamate dioxygenase ferredoxin subunit
LEKVKTIKSTDIAINSSASFETNTKQIALFNCEGQFYAIDDMCSHAEASLSEGEVYDCKVECPLHGAEFDLKTGEAVTLPATQSINTYKTEIIDGYIYVEIGTNA